VGIYGVMAYGVALRRRELGVRSAIGARPADLARLVLRQGLTLAAAGILGGTVVVFGAVWTLRGLIEGVAEVDPLGLAAAATLLLLAAGLATWLPARRVAAREPAIALRGD